MSIEVPVKTAGMTQPDTAAPAKEAPHPVAMQVKGLNFYYGTSHALHDISLDFPERSVTGMIGPSGCGKSTLLRVLNRMYDLYPGQRATGEVIFDKQNILNSGVDLNVLRSRIGMVFQKPTPFPMSIYDNIAFGIRLHERVSRSEMDGRVEDALRRVALWPEVQDRLSASATALSGGQQQRLCIARTIAVRPEVILLDEPTSALDPVSTARIEELLDELKTEFTIAIVTHNMQQAARCADQVAFFYMGRLIEVDSTARMFTTRVSSRRRITSQAGLAEAIRVRHGGKRYGQRTRTYHYPLRSGA